MLYRTTFEIDIVIMERGSF